MTKTKENEIEKEKLKKITTDFTHSAYNSLKKKNFLVEKNVLKSRIERKKEKTQSILLSDSQKVAFNAIENWFQKEKIFLLHGVTSSGKTEIYVELMKKYRKENQQILFLVPEVALTEHLIKTP